jgi:outer membrane protein TolC
MMSKMKFVGFLCAFLCLFSITGRGQESRKVLTIDEFYDFVLANHPVVSQARLFNDLAKQEIRIARGAFDPKIGTYYARKRFGEDLYYSMWDHSLRVPIWFNTDLQFGYEQTGGAYLNPQNRVPEAGLAYAGISVPIGQGLIIDARRATLRQAQLYAGMAEADRIKLINKILLDAAKDYWEWFYAYHQLVLFEEAQALADTRYHAVRENVLLGDAAPIDSVEALIAVQNRNISLQRAAIHFQNMTLVLSNYLWDNEQRPLEIQNNTIPVLNARLSPVNEQDLAWLTELARERHPDLVKIDLDIQRLEVDRRLAREFLKPQLNLNYNFLSRPVFNGPESEFSPAFFNQNYTLGVSFGFPLFLRAERGRFQRANIRLTQANYERGFRNREIFNQVNVEYNELRNTADLIGMQSRMVRNYEILLEGEVTRFEEGESSLFLVNARETTLIDSRAKLLELKVKYEKLMANLFWAAGVENLRTSE